MALYRNWPEICKVGRTDKMLMLVLASVSLTRDNDILAGLYVGFPQCFSAEKIEGPFPLSIIRDLARDSAVVEGFRGDGADFPYSYDVISGLEVPCVHFTVLPRGETVTDSTWPIFPLPIEEVWEKLKQGDAYEWRGKQLLVLESNCAPENDWWHIHLAPAECIALDL
jgi:hypothetical protein